MQGGAPHETVPERPKGDEGVQRLITVPKLQQGSGFVSLRSLSRRTKVRAACYPRAKQNQGAEGGYASEAAAALARSAVRRRSGVDARGRAPLPVARSATEKRVRRRAGWMQGGAPPCPSAHKGRQIAQSPLEYLARATMVGSGA